MNRFIRCSLIMGLCLSILGFGMAIAARANGGNWEQLNLRNHSITIGDRYWHYDSAWEENTAQVSIVEEVDEDTFLFPLVSELELELDACEITITEGESEGIFVSCDSYYQMQDLVWISYDEGELSIHTVKKDNRTPKITVTVPPGWLFEEAVIELVSGNCEIQNINIQELNVYLSEGKLTIQNGVAYEADFQCANGSISYEGLLLGDVDIQCTGGSVSLDLQQAKEEFNYEIEQSIGEVRIGTQKFTGISYEKEIVNHAEWTMELQCVAGKIQIVYLTEE